MAVGVDSGTGATISYGPAPGSGAVLNWSIPFMLIHPFVVLVSTVWWYVSYALYIAGSIAILPLTLYSKYLRNKWSHHLVLKYDRTDPALQREVGMSPELYQFFLREAMYTGDPSADRAFDEIGGKWNFRASAVGMLRTAAATGAGPASAQLIKEVEAVPAWVDFDQIAIAQRMFWRISPFYLWALYSYSLPLPYCSAAGVTTLALTGRMRDDLYRRLFDTLQFVVDLMSDLRGPASVGVDAALKARLIHCHVRKFINRLHPEYNTQFSCTPINQAHLTGMLAGFSYHPIQVARMYGAHISHAEHAAHVHMWQYVGCLMGIDRRLWVPSVDAEPRWARMAFQMDLTPNDSTREYVHALLDDEKRFGTTLWMVPSPVIAESLRHAAGDELYEIFRIPVHNPLWRLTPALMTGAAMLWNVYNYFFVDFQIRRSKARTYELLANGPHKFFATAQKANTGIQVGLSAPAAGCVVSGGLKLTATPTTPTAAALRCPGGGGGSGEMSPHEFKN